jgi:transcriptional regulator with XRE-family HTH domain
VRDFAAYLLEISKGFPSRKAFAEAIGVVPPRLSRVMAGEDAYSFNVENCLRLAKVANRPPGEVLRAAGKAEAAELLEFLFPKAGKPAVTADQKQLLDDWALLNEDERSAFRMLIHGRVAERKRRVS